MSFQLWFSIKIRNTVGPPVPADPSAPEEPPEPDTPPVPPAPPTPPVPPIPPDPAPLTSFPHPMRAAQKPSGMIIKPSLVNVASIPSFSCQERAKSITSDVGRPDAAYGFDSTL